MKTFVIAGGTDGIGKATAHACLARGDEVVVLGRNAEKGAAFLSAAAEAGAADRAHFLEVDLSMVGQTRDVVRDLAYRFTKIDGLVLCAQHFRSVRLVTGEGFEQTFALYYLGRFILSHGLADLLAASDAPVVVNVCGPGIDLGEIRWWDLGRERDYSGIDALMQGSRLNDLLGVGFMLRNPASPVRYVLLNPGAVQTSFSGQYDPAMAAQIEAMREVAQPVEEGIVPVVDALYAPPAAPLTASMQGRPIDLGGPAFDTGAARRLLRLTVGLLGADAFGADSALGGDGAERDYVAFVEEWIRLHNTDPRRMVDECYHPDAVIVVPGVEQFGVERLRELEAEGSSRAVQRQTRVERVIASGDVVAVEGMTATTVDEGSAVDDVSWCVVLTVRDGRIVSDHAYLNTHKP